MIILFLQTMESCSKIRRLFSKSPKEEKGSYSISHCGRTLGPDRKLYHRYDFFLSDERIHVQVIHSPPRPCEVHTDNQRKGKTPKPQCFLCSLTPKPTCRMTLLANTGITKKAIHAKVQKFQPSVPVLEIEGCKQALKAPLAAFFLHFPSERCTKD